MSGFSPMRWQGPLVPAHMAPLHRTTSGNFTFTMDAAGEKVAFLGRLKIVGEASGKTFSSSGGKIHFYPNAVVWATAGSTVRIGLQDVDLSGVLAVPDGSFDVYADIVQGTDSLATGTWKAVSMSSGSKSLSHGDMIAVVFDFVTRNGADIFRPSPWSQTTGLPSSRLVGNLYDAGASWVWGGNIPTVVIEFDDGTLATIEATTPTTTANESFQDSTNPDSRGLIFELPESVTITGLWAMVSAASAAATAKLELYSDPLGSPALLESVSCTAAEIHSVMNICWTRPDAFAARTLAANTPYWIGVTATGTALVTLSTLSLRDAADRALFYGGATLRKGARNNASGAFSETTTLLPVCGFVADGVGGGGGSAVGFPLGRIVV